jgi:hypothetical protein
LQREVEYLLSATAFILHSASRSDGKNVAARSNCHLILLVDCGRFQWLFPEIVLTVTSFLDHKRNEDILEKLKVEPVDEKLRRYKSNWLRHVSRMKKLQDAENNSPNGRRRLGRPLKRLLDEAETGLSRPNS